VHVGGSDGPAVDSYNVTFGARDAHFDADRGFFLNRQHVKLRGFCDFGPFGAVGAATPDRVHLYRAQVLRSVGANSWRMAHNPPAPGRLDVMDRLGMLALDENHYYGTCSVE
jgi:beta-galactosidase